MSSVEDLASPLPNRLRCDYDATCSATFNRKSDRTRHKEERHEPRKQCPCCSFNTPRRSRLKKHLEINHGITRRLSPMSILPVNLSHSHQSLPHQSTIYGTKPHSSLPSTSSSVSSNNDYNTQIIRSVGTSSSTQPTYAVTGNISTFPEPTNYLSPTMTPSNNILASQQAPTPSTQPDHGYDLAPYSPFEIPNYHCIWHDSRLPVDSVPNTPTDASAIMANGTSPAEPTLVKSSQSVTYPEKSMNWWAGKVF